MAQSYFIWNGRDSRAEGLILRRAAPLIRPEERVKHTTIPGLSGDLTETEGEHIYNSYIQTVEFSVTDGSRVHSVFRWLRGGGYVTFSSDPDKRQEARLIGAVTLEKVSRNLDHWAGQAQFYCQPLKQRTYEPTQTLTEAATIWNAGDVPSRPVILAYPGAADTITITVNGQTLTLTDIRGVRRIDSQIQEVSNAARTLLVTKNTAGPFPVLQPGANEVSFTGCTKIVITPRERFL